LAAPVARGVVAVGTGAGGRLVLGAGQGWGRRAARAGGRLVVLRRRHRVPRGAPAGSGAGSRGARVEGWTVRCGLATHHPLLGFGPPEAVSLPAGLAEGTAAAAAPGAGGATAGGA